MSDTISVKAVKREIFGKKLRSVREDGLVPAVLHNHGKESIHVSIDAKELIRVNQEAGKHSPVEITLDSKPHTALLRDIDYVPGKKRMLHAVFQLVRANEKIETTVPLVLTDEIPATRAGLQVNELLKELDIRALTKDLVDLITVDASNLVEIGDSITVADIKAPSGIEIITDLETVIANVEALVDQEKEADAAAEELAADADKPVAEDVPATEQKENVEEEIPA